jgi:hypothetical protein
MKADARAVGAMAQQPWDADTLALNERLDEHEGQIIAAEVRIERIFDCMAQACAAAGIPIPRERSLRLVWDSPGPCLPDRGTSRDRSHLRLVKS